MMNVCNDPNIHLSIKMDFREDASQIEEILSCRYGINVLRTRLPVGDYIIDKEIVVERKTTLDFALSIIDGRLFKQIARMRQFFDEVFLIIEGKDLYNLPVDIHPHAIKGALISISVSWQTPILFSNDIEETAFLLWLTGKQVIEKKQELSYRQGRRPKRMRRRQMYILQGLPQVGPKLAGQLLDFFGSVERVITAKEEELTKVSGLGKKKARMIREIVGGGQ